MPATLAARADSRHRGFTLIEIAVVLLVIFVLAAIAIPNYKTYALRARGEYGHLVIHLEGESTAPVSTFARAAAVMARPSGPESAFPQAIGERFADATAVFNIHKQIALDETKTIKLVMSRRKTEAELVPHVYRYGESKSAVIQVGKTMQALLVSDDNDGLSIVEKAPRTQDLLDTGYTYWLWDARAKKPGTYRLTLTISVDSDIDGVRLQRAVTTHEEEIAVVVSTQTRVTHFVKNNWQWLWTLLAAPAIPWAWKKWRQRQQKRTELLP
jgi:prepilin-type N-terminal cleavage/methylation domain-containing protein